MKLAMHYPFSRTENSVETAAGIEFPDPYRWLENETEEVQEWQTAQNQLASDYVHEWPHFEALQKSVVQYLVDRISIIPRFAAGQWFRSDQGRIIVSPTPYDEGRVIFDVQSGNSNSSSVLSWMVPSPNGAILAIGICDDGSESNTIRLVDVDSGVLLTNPPKQMLMDNWTGGAAWLPDSTGFYFLAFEGDPANFKQRIFFHRMDDGVQSPIDIPLPDADSQDYLLITISADGRYHIANQGSSNLRPIALLDTEQSDSKWRPFVTDVVGSVYGHVIGDQLIAVTDVGAPRSRIVAIPLNTTTPNDPGSWIERVQESEAVIRSVTPVGQFLYITEIVDTYSRVRIVDLTGKILGEVPLPGKGAIAEAYFPLDYLIPKGHPDEYLFSFSTFTQSCGVYRHRPGEADIETLDSPQISIDHAIVEDHWASSEDGTQIPYHSVRLASTDISAPQPTLMYGYGGFKIPLLPEYPGAMMAFVAAGGVFIHAHLRGGGEFGLDWWQGGCLQNKQNCYKDLYAIAEDLINSGRTTRQQLAVNGPSNGGLMAGVAATQRPDLWKAVVPRVPILDLIGALRDPYARKFVKDEFGDPDDPEEVKRMAAFSAYHLVKEYTEYPAIFLDAGATDPRCPPWHARKFAARLQAANANDTPILLHVWENAGHGQATDRHIQSLQYTEWLAFVMRQLGMQLL